MHHTSTRRQFVHAGLATSAGLWSVQQWARRAQAHDEFSGQLQVAPFRFDVSPPMGHGCCGGWIKPVEVIDDPLLALGFVLLGAGDPIVLCAVDWTGILNHAHVAWRSALAEAAGTTPDRVAVHCVHQHNAPFACLDAQALIAAQGDLPSTLDTAYFDDCLARGRAAVSEALRTPQAVTHVAYATGLVEEVACNRRIVSPEGVLTGWRGSACADPALRALPDGLIDPLLKTVAFYQGERKLVAAHYYATHPMSFYGDGRVTSDFVGLARARRQNDEPDTLHLYFTGCAGNIAAGKYNDGTPEARVRLTDRIYAGMVASDAALAPQPVESVRWRVNELRLAPNPAFDIAALERQIADKSQPIVARNRPSFTVAFARRCAEGLPILLSALHVNDISLVHLPSETFLEYQLRAQECVPDRRVAVAGYGDGGPWYLPTAEAYPQGGYEVSVAFADPSCDPLLTAGIEDLFAG